MTLAPTASISSGISVNFSTPQGMTDWGTYVIRVRSMESKDSRKTDEKGVARKHIVALYRTEKFFLANRYFFHFASPFFDFCNL